jgi:hypothetical protein
VIIEHRCQNSNSKFILCLLGLSDGSKFKLSIIIYKAIGRNCDLSWAPNQDYSFIGEINRKFNLFDPYSIVLFTPGAKASNPSWSLGRRSTFSLYFGPQSVKNSSQNTDNFRPHVGCPYFTQYKFFKKFR